MTLIVKTGFESFGLEMVLPIRQISTFLLHSLTWISWISHWFKMSHSFPTSTKLVLISVFLVLVKSVIILPVTQAEKKCSHHKLLSILPLSQTELYSGPVSLTSEMFINTFIIWPSSALSVLPYIIPLFYIVLFSVILLPFTQQIHIFSFLSNYHNYYY